MARRSSKSKRSSIALPWEQRGNFFRQLISGQRWKMALLGLAVVMTAVFFYNAAEERRRERLTRIAITDVRRAVYLFRAQVGRCPHSNTELVHPPRARTRYLREMPKDGWSRELLVRCPAADDIDDVDVVSAGPSGDFFIDDNLY